MLALLDAPIRLIGAAMKRPANQRVRATRTPAPRPNGRTQRRRELVSHWPPPQSARLTETIGVNRRRLTRSQRVEILALMEEYDFEDPAFRAAVADVVNRRVSSR